MQDQAEVLIAADSVVVLGSPAKRSVSDFVDDFLRGKIPASDFIVPNTWFSFSVPPNSPWNMFPSVMENYPLPEGVDYLYE